MKAKNKRNHLEGDTEEKEKNYGEDERRDKDRGDDDDDDGQEQPTTTKKPRKNRVLACLQSAWARMTCKKRKSSSHSIIIPLMDATDSRIQEALLQEHQLLCDQYHNLDDLRALYYAEQEATLEDYQRWCDQTNNMDDICALHYVGQIAMEEEYQELCDRIHSVEFLYAQHYMARYEENLTMTLTYFPEVSEQEVAQGVENLVVQDVVLWSKVLGSCDSQKQPSLLAWHRDLGSVPNASCVGFSG
ncbi:uncharacterized protein [Dendropsophus ebraccatus]|uniref:uncharacterized protein n=1 Tax=Dendropsophus ebraccatus TaxID=150705 RepID=UPI0038313A4E